MAAIVTDSGGVLSHAAIVAREYGLPAVVGAMYATRLVTDGQLITVDGDAGVVLLAQPPFNQPERRPCLTASLDYAPLR